MVPAAPDVRFDGYDQQVGGGQNLYPVYNPIVSTHLLDLGKLSVTASIVVDAQAGTGTIDAQVIVADGETIANPGECRIRCVVYEDDIVLCCDPRGNDDWHTIARDMLPVVTLTAANSNDVQDYDQVFTLNPAWDTDNLHAIVFVQRDSNKRILNATGALSLYNVELATLDFPTQRVEGAPVPVEFDQQVTYTGATTDDVVVSLDESALPAGWSAEIVHDSVTHPGGFTIPAMATNETADLLVRIIPDATAGLGKVSVTVEPASLPAEAQSAGLAAIVNTTAVLFVDDDQGASFEGQYETAITGAGYEFVTHDFTGLGAPTTAYLNVFDAVVWSTGELETNTIDSAADLQIRGYLDGGGKFFLASQGYIDDRSLNLFSINYLKVASRVLDVGATAGNGLAGDPIGDGLAMTLSPPFIDRADRINPNTGAVAWLANQNALPIGIRYDSGVFKTVYLAAAFEGLPSALAADPNNQKTVMKRVLDWFIPSVTGVQAGPGGAASALQLAQNAPNPFAATTSLRFALPAAGRVTLSIYDISGRRVASLLDRTMDAGSHAIEWNGRDESGRAVANGVYLARIQAGGETATRELVRMK